MLGKSDLLYAHFHQPIWTLIYRVIRYIIFQILLHLRNIEHSSSRHFLELLIINVSTVHCYDVASMQCSRLEHEGVIGGCGGKLYIRRYPFICVYYDDSAVSVPRVAV